MCGTIAAAGCGGSDGAARDGGAEEDGAAGAPDAEAGPPAVCDLRIDCGGADIPDEPKIACQIEIGDGLGGVVHAGRIGIERRGRSSIDFPKAQYSVELRSETDAELAVGLFGMGRESDWVLNGMYVDRALFRNKLFFDVFQGLGGPERYAPETHYCELTLDGDYRGIYLLTEKIKRDDDRIALADDGGVGASFILKQDEAGFREVGVAYGSWRLVYPNDLTATQPQIDGVSAWLDGWQAAVEGTSDTDVFTLMDLDSAVDFVLLQELVKGNDAYFLSMHVWKDTGGKLHFTPWDIDLSLGQPLYNDSTLTTGWVGPPPAAHPGAGRRHPIPGPPGRALEPAARDRVFRRGDRGPHPALPGDHRPPHRRELRALADRGHPVPRQPAASPRQLRRGDGGGPRLARRPAPLGGREHRHLRGAGAHSLTTRSTAKMPRW